MYEIEVFEVGNSRRFCCGMEFHEPALEEGRASNPINHTDCKINLNQFLILLWRCRIAVSRKSVFYDGIHGEASFFKLTETQTFPQMKRKKGQTSKMKANIIFIKHRIFDVKSFVFSDKNSAALPICKYVFTWREFQIKFIDSSSSSLRSSIGPALK